MIHDLWNKKSSDLSDYQVIFLPIIVRSISQNWVALVSCDHSPNRPSWFRKLVYFKLIFYFIDPGLGIIFNKSSNHWEEINVSVSEWGRHSIDLKGRTWTSHDDLSFYGLKSFVIAHSIIHTSQQAQVILVSRGGVENS